MLAKNKLHTNKWKNWYTYIFTLVHPIWATYNKKITFYKWWSSIQLFISPSKSLLSFTQYNHIHMCQDTHTKYTIYLIYSPIRCISMYTSWDPSQDNTWLMTPCVRDHKNDNDDIIQSLNNLWDISQAPLIHAISFSWANTSMKLTRTTFVKNPSLTHLHRRSISSIWSYIIISTWDLYVKLSHIMYMHIIMHIHTIIFHIPHGAYTMDTLIHQV